MLSKKVSTILVSFEAAKARISNKANVKLTGTPTKIKKLDLSKSQKAEAIKRLGLKPEKPVVLVFGGSQGAKAINDSVIKIINEKLNKDYQIMWAPGPIQYDIVKKEINNISKLEAVKIVPYIYNMEEVMNACDLIISRSGAMTITEISIVGKPAIFIPLPNVSNDHQVYNAKVLENVGAAKILLNENLNKDTLNSLVEEIIRNPKQMQEMAENARKIAITNVEDKIYEEIKRLVK